MKRFSILLAFAILYGCGCLAQIPPQYVYVDDQCSATLPDYLGLVVVQDNCEVTAITQIPAAGTPITITTEVEIQAADAAGNVSSVYFNAVLLDTIPPNIQLNPDWTGYSRQEVDDMYKTFYGFVQERGAMLNELYAGQPYTLELWDGLDTVLYTDTLKIYNNVIPIPDDFQGKWWEGGGEISYIFQNPIKVFMKDTSQLASVSFIKD